MANLYLDAEKYYRMLVDTIYDPDNIKNKHRAEVIRRVMLQKQYPHGVKKTPARYTSMDGILFEEAHRLAKEAKTSFVDVLHALVSMYVANPTFRNELHRGLRGASLVDEYVQFTRAVVEGKVTNELADVFSRAVVRTDTLLGWREWDKEARETAKIRRKQKKGWQ